LAADQLKVELPPVFSVPGEALNFTLGPNPEPTVTVADCVAVPPGPTQLSV